MAEIHYIEKSPRRWDFCGCPPCGLCYEPVLIADQKAPTFQEVMKVIYGDDPAPQTEQEYEWAHAAAFQTLQELDARQPEGGFYEAEDQTHTTQVRIDDLLKRARYKALAPKPLNRINLDDMPIEQIEAMVAKQEEKVRTQYIQYAPMFTPSYQQPPDVVVAQQEMARKFLKESEERYQRQQWGNLSSAAVGLSKIFEP